MNSNWNGVENLIKNKVPEHSYKMWFEPLKLNQISTEKITLSCPNIFFKNHVLKTYGQLLKTSVNKIMGEHLTLQIIISKTTDLKETKTNFTSKPNVQLTLPGTNLQPTWARKLRKDFTFEEFVVGSNNDFAYSAALSIASKDNGDINSLFLLSKTGLGKSHLSQAVGHHIISRFPHKRAYYVTAEDFTNEMVNAYKNNNIEHFKEKYRKNCDVLLMDEIQYFSGKVGTQKELASTLDFLTDRGKKIIFSSSELPTEIPKLSDRLRSRLSSGLVTSLEIPDYETRIKILKQKIKSTGNVLPLEVIQYLAAEISGDIRQLESGLVGITAKASLLGCKADLALASSVVKNIITNRTEITVELIKKIICNYYNVSITDLLSQSRRRSIVWPRQIAMYLSRRYTNHSLQFLGKSFNRYHATCMHAVKTIDKSIKTSISTQKQIDFLSKKLEYGNF